MKTKQKRTTAYDIFRKNEDPAYPQMLAKFIQDPQNYEYEIQKAQYLLELWVEDYRNMPQIDKSIYYTIIPKFLKRLFAAYTKRGKAIRTLTVMYFLQYKKWLELTEHIQKGLNQSQLASLTILWNISQKLVQTIQNSGVPESDQYGQFLSDQFQQPLSNYKWKSHEQKMRLLQTVKFLNAHFQYQPFIDHGKKWLSIIKAIKQQQFKSQIIREKGQLRLQLYKFEYKQKKSQFSDLQKTAVSIDEKSPKNKKPVKTGKKNDPKKEDKYQLDKQKQFQKQFLSKQQINMFLVVKDQTQQKQIYRLQILSQIINCRSLICKISQQYWDKLALGAIQQINQRMQDLNYLIRTDVLLSKLLLTLLKYRKTATIIRQQIGQQIVVKIIKNIQYLQKNSPFQNFQLAQIPTLVNQAFFHITPQMAAQGVTVQTIINKRIKSIIEQANAGKDDIINRALMTVSCREQMRLRKTALNDIIQFLIHLKKKKGVSIQTCIILVKILLSSIKTKQLRQLQIYSLSLALTQITQMYQVHKKVTQLRKLCILLQLLLIPLMKLDFTEQGILVDSLLKWLQLVENNFKIVFAPMIKILTLLIDKYKDYYNSQQKAVDVLEKILTGINQKLGHQHNNDNMFTYLQCILKGYIKLNWNVAYNIYQDIPKGSFIDWEIIYRKQARIIFKREDQLKIKNKQAELQAKLAKQKEWNNSLKRKQTMPRNNKQAKKNQQNAIIDITAEEKKCEQKMNIYFGDQEKQWLKELITSHQLWRRQNIMRSQFGCLEFSLIQTVCEVQKDFYIKTQRPNQFIKRIIQQLDEDIYELYLFLMQEQSYQLLFLFASKIYFLTRDFFFVKKLKSYRLIQSRCFQILSTFFNKVQILYASSLFCSLIVPYANNKQLKQVYDDLNQQQFLTDLFKGSNQFIGKQKCYYPWLLKILMAYQMTQQFRMNLPLVKESLISLGKNVTWWGNVQYMINAQIQINDHDDQDQENKVILNVNLYGSDNNFNDGNQNYINKRLIFDLFKEQYKKLMDQYFSRIQKIIVLKKQQEAMGLT